MFQVGPYTFKKAQTSREFDQIHRLNYRTFVTEIPQHPDPGNERLVDKFHEKNTYIIALERGQVVAMLSTHDQPPFSVADRLPDPRILEALGMRPLEVRQLAVEPDKRNSTLFFGLVWTLYDHAEANGYSHLIISGVTSRLEMYRQIGFEALGPAVPSGNASFVPMALRIGGLSPRVQRIKRRWEEHLEQEAVGTWVDESPTNDVADKRIIGLLPGPVMVAPAVHRAFQQLPIYHRGPEFITLFRRVRHALGALAGGRNVALFNGSGTLANEAVAATLAALPQPGRGILLVNGEFGLRLTRQAERFGLNPRVLSWRWGQPWDLDEVADALREEPEGSYVWGVHQESSTGVLNDLPGLARIAGSHGVRVCVDCISSLGAVPLDLSDVFLATGATGKSLGSFAGLAIVFANAEQLRAIDTGRIPSYLDVPAALASDGPRYTFPSSSVLALDAALADYRTPAKAEARYETYDSLGRHVRERLRQLGLGPLADESCACPVITTFAPPDGATSAAFVARCREWGFAIGGQSDYLSQRRLVQIATMGVVTQDDCAPLFEHLESWLGRKVTPREAVAL